MDVGAEPVSGTFEQQKKSGQIGNESGHQQEHAADEDTDTVDHRIAGGFHRGNPPIQIRPRFHPLFFCESGATNPCDQNDDDGRKQPYCFSEYISTAISAVGTAINARTSHFILNTFLKRLFPLAREQPRIPASHSLSTIKGHLRDRCK